MSPAKRVVFLGSKTLGLRCLEKMYSLRPDALAAVITIDDRQDARSAYAGMEAFCGQKRIPHRVAKNLKQTGQFVQEAEPHLGFVCGWYQLLSQELLDVAQRGFLGIHYSPLPKYRGGSPLVWQIINGEPEVALSLFSFTAGMDDGDIWARARVPIGHSDTIADVAARLDERSLAVLDEKYLAILDGTLEPIPQDHSQATYCAPRQPDDGAIPWSSSAAAVYNFIRAQTHPYPGAFTWLSGEKLIVWKARMENIIFYGTPGQVARVSADGVYVVCGDNRPVVLERVEWKGQQEDASNLLKSVKIRFPPGMVPTVPAK
jgi:methionyl-tRNA formyltransferase